MGHTWIGRLTAIFVLVGSVGSADADDPPGASKTAAPEKTATAPATPAPAASTTDSTPASATPAPTAHKKSRKVHAAASELFAVTGNAATVRARTLESLKKLPKPDDKAATTKTKVLVKLYEERCTWLDEWDKSVGSRQAAENPSPSPEKQSETWKSELEQAKALLAKSEKDPTALLPASLRGGAQAKRSADAIDTDLKAALASAQTDLKDWSKKLDQVRNETGNKDGSQLATIRDERDKAFKREALLKDRNLEQESGFDSAKTPDALEVARETAVNLDWEGRVEAERLQALEANLALETKRAEIAPLQIQMLETHVALAQRSVNYLKARCQELADRAERELHAKAQKEQSRAAQSDDPVEKYRAKRAADLLEEERRAVLSENYLATDPPPSLDQQRRLADDAVKDFTKVKHLLDDGNVSHLDALRLNNDFRRIGLERPKIVANELATTANRLTMVENALNDVELELGVRPSRRPLRIRCHPRSRLPAARRTDAKALFEQTEKAHFALLERRKKALDQIASRAQETHEQVLRRLQVLDDHFGFVRTHIFWVRDEEPLGESTLPQARRELILLGQAVARTAGELNDRGSWERVSVEFLSATLGLAILPWPLFRVRRALKRAEGAAMLPTKAQS